MVDRAAGRLIRSTFRPLFWVLAVLYLCHRLLVWLHLPRPDWLRFYLDDLLCLPLILTATLFVMRIFFGPKVRFSGYHVAFAVLYVAIVFEIVLPNFMPRYTTDVVDVFLYALGGAIFYLFLNK